VLDEIERLEDDVRPALYAGAVDVPGRLLMILCLSLAIVRRDREQSLPGQRSEGKKLHQNP